MTAYVIGRAADCDIRVVSEYASPHHARVFQDAAGWWIGDLGSTNGTHLVRHGQTLRVTVPQLLLPGDVIVVGRVRIPWQPPSEAGPIRVTADIGQRLNEEKRE